MLLVASSLSRLATHSGASSSFGRNVRAYKKANFVALVIAIASCAQAQKVEVGYDKSVNFEKYKTYSWAEAATPPARPMLYQTVVGWIDGDLNSKGFQRVDKDGDLILEATGGIGFGISVAGGQPLTSSYNGPPPSLNATMWTGAGGQRELMPAVPDASLELKFIDHRANQIVWSGLVTQALDMDRKDKSLDLVDKAVTKLLKRFPPKTSK